MIGVLSAGREPVRVTLSELGVFSTCLVWQSTPFRNPIFYHLLRALHRATEGGEWGGAPVRTAPEMWFSMWLARCYWWATVDTVGNFS